MVPFIICILTLFPNVKRAFEWFEYKYTDFLFAYYPEICLYTGQVEKIESPTVIIQKDYSFQTRFNRSPNRKDFADLLEILRKQGVKVAAFDYIYDEKNKEDEDNAFIKELDLFPYPILAYNYVAHSHHTFNIEDYIDDNADKVTNIVPLYRPISEKAVARGLINIPSDLDEVKRIAPIGFHLSDSKRFLLSLGFTTWIVSLFEEREEELNNIDISNSTDLYEAIKALKVAAPYKIKTIGHDGIDRAILDLENNLLYKFIIKRYPKFKSNDLFELRKIYEKLNHNKTWINLPEKPLPIIGTYDMPCIRLAYQKLAYPFVGDGIDAISMGRLLNREEDDNSAFLFSKNQLTLSTEETFQKFKPSIPTQTSGLNSLEGDIVTVDGNPVKKAKIWAIMSKTGYWEKTEVDENGHYKLENLPEGNFFIIVFIENPNGCDKAMLNVAVNQREKKLPLLMFDKNINSIEIPSEIIPNNNDSELWIYGGIIPMLYSNNEGSTFVKKIPDGFSINIINDNEDDENSEEQTLSINEKGELTLNNELCRNTVVAVLPDEDNWNLSFYRKISLKKGNDYILNGLPSSLDAIINVTTKHSLRISKNNMELPIKPGVAKLLTTLPRPFQDYKPNINLHIESPIKDTDDIKVIMLSDFGKEIEIKAGNTANIPTSESYVVLTQSGSLRGFYKQETIHHKTVFLGTTLPTDQDFVVTPINFMDKSFNKMAGVHIHANLFSALTQGRFFYSPAYHLDRAPDSWPFLQFLLYFPILVLLNIILKDAKSTKTTTVIVIIVFFICFISVVLFPKRIIIPVFYPCLMVIGFGVARSFVEWINSRRLATETQNAFSHFISADVVNQIINNPNAIRPGGEKKELTVMFTDIAGFTSISEKLDADALTELMNSYLDEMTNILFKHGGTLDKYIGDAIMGFWNHPTIEEDHATRAVTCAIEMQKKLKEMREKWMAQGLPKVEMRAGINTGTCMVGFIGSKIQMNFTCLGDNVNLASRLEGANKAYGTFIMISESVKKQLNPYLFSIRFLDFLAVKGKNEPVLVYEVRGWINEENEVWKEKAGNIYQQGIDKYLAREWDNAISLFKEVLKLVPDDAPSKVYIDRCEHFKQQPPDENWDGRFVLKTK